ncbi:MAG: DNA-binding response regulator [marine bacterium B5-7]|nr:MAG: DNA-binding response regulator [marine bacterium B5-7]
MRLLLVEDDIQLADDLKSKLRRAGFVVDISHDGLDGEFKGDTESYDAVILDLGLPKQPGLDVLRNWRERHNDVPVLILTARGAWHEKVDGFKAGADDYLSKPFHIEELVARLQVLIRRRHGHIDVKLTVGDLTLDADQQEVMVHEQDNISLTATEFRLLEYLMQHHDKIISKSRLIEHALDSESSDDENIIEVYINRLRRKIGAKRIETRRGQGYRLKELI